MWSRLSKLERASLAVLAAALAVRVIQAWAYRDHLVWDVAWYMSMGRSLVEAGEFFEPATGAYTHHYPPLWPILLAGGAAGGGAMAFTKILAFLCGLAMVAVVGGLTWHLYGREAGLAAAAVFAAFPALVHYDALGYPESLLVTLYAVTLWSIVVSLKRPPFILLGGLAAGLAYLTKASVGPFFLLAAAGGLAWRLWHRRGAALKDYWYLAAGAVFASLVLLWTWRNVARFGLSGWETQPYATESLKAAFAQAGWPLVLLMKLAFAAFFLAAFTLPWWDRLRRPVREVLRDEAASALWLAALMPAFIALFFMLAFKYAEGRPAWDPDDARYLLVSLVPLLWLALDPRRDGAAAASGAPAAEGAAPAEPSGGAAPGRAVAWAVGVALFLLLALDLRAESGGRNHVGPMVFATALVLLAGAAVLGWREQPEETRRRSAPERALALLMEKGLAQSMLTVVLLLVLASVAWWRLFPSLSAETVNTAYKMLFAVAAAAGGALLLRGAIPRALAFAGILLGASLAGATLTTPWTAAQPHVEGRLAEGETVAVPARQAHFASAVLDAPVVPLEKTDNDTRLILIPRPPRGTAFEGFQVVGIHKYGTPILPGTQVRRALQGAFGFEVAPIEPGTGLAVFERPPNATG